MLDEGEFRCSGGVSKFCSFNAPVVLLDSENWWSVTIGTWNGQKVKTVKSVFKGLSKDKSLQL